MKKVFIDGSSGTTGLRIHERLRSRSDLRLLELPEALRKDPAARRDMLNQADIAFLCLPDAAAMEAVDMIENDRTVVIDTSTAHRTAEGWVYGFPEIHGARGTIRNAHRIANPGCHASGFVSLIAPLTERGLLPANAHLSCWSLTGYSGGGKNMIAQYEEDELPLYFDAPRAYGLTQKHKHLPEMQKLCGLSRPPAFSPIVASYYSGMEVSVTLFADELNGTIEDVRELYRSYYTGRLVRYIDGGDEAGFLSASRLSGYDNMLIGVFGSEDRIQLVSRFDNLGNGASGAAIQNMNLVLGEEETTGLEIMEETEYDSEN